DICDRYGIIFILDEVITGFRLGLGGAQKYFDVTPDLAIFGKAMASGYPISVLAGKKKYMGLVANSKVIHAGTMNSCNPCVAAALATIEVLEKDNTSQKIAELGKILMVGIQDAGKRHGHNLLVQGMGPMFHVGFTDLEKVTDYRGTLSYDKAKYGKFAWELQQRGIRLIGRGLWYISNAHNDADIQCAISTADEVLGEMKE
ncbi:MAG: aminotransferase class III-fold pyridoxal phosphate-dependent enzyme, partial [Abditibacteriaceae bacterium]